MSAAFTIFCDGASRGNPGPAAIGAVIYSAYDPQSPAASAPTALREISERIGQATNNEAEYRALIRALEVMVEFMQSSGSGDEVDSGITDNANSIQIYLDSELVVKQIRGQYRVKNARLKTLYDQAHALLQKIDQWQIDHVRREANTVADGLANLALDQK